MKKVALLLSVVFFMPLLATAFLVAASSEANAAVDVVCFNDLFQRKIGQPRHEHNVFTAIAGPATVKVYNGDGSGWIDRATVANVIINGKVIFRASDFNKRVKYLLANVNLLAGNNTVDVNLLGMPGVRLRVEVIQGLEADAAAVVGTSGGIISVSQTNSPIYGAKVEIPQGALSQIKTIMISQTEEPEKGVVSSLSAGPFISIGPGGTIFNTPVKVYIPYNDIDDDGLIDGTNESEEKLLVFCLDETTGLWEELPIIEQDLDNNIVIVEAFHFSTFAAFINYSERCELFSDGFDGKLSDKWEEEENHWFNRSQMIKGNAKIENGILKLIAKAPRIDESQWEGAGILSKKNDFSYGTYMARIKAAAGTPYLTGFFTYFHDAADINHEIDIEIWGKNPNEVFFTVWTRYQEGVNNKSYSIKIDFSTGDYYRKVDGLPADWQFITRDTRIPNDFKYYNSSTKKYETFNVATQFHVYQFDWKDSSVQFKIDGKDVCLIHRAEMSNNEIPSMPSKVLINTWIPAWKDQNNNWLTNPVNTSEETGTTFVDWVWIGEECDVERDWTTPIEVISNGGSPMDMVVSADGTRHVAYGKWSSDYSSVAITYANSATSWAENTIKTYSSSTLGDLNDISLGIDSTGKLHLMYDADSFSTGVITTHYTSKAFNGSWSSDQVITRTLGSPMDMVVSADGTRHIVYSKWGTSSFTINYANSSNNYAEVFIKEYSFTSYVEPESICLGQDSSGRLHLMFNLETRSSGAPGAIKTYYTSKPLSGSWSTPQEVISKSGSPMGMVVSPDGTRHLAFTEWGSTYFRIYYSNSSSNFTNKVLIGEYAFTSYVEPESICLGQDSSGRLHMMFNLETRSSGAPGTIKTYYAHD